MAVSPERGLKKADVRGVVSVRAYHGGNDETNLCRGNTQAALPPKISRLLPGSASHASEATEASSLIDEACLGGAIRVSARGATTARGRRAPPSGSYFPAGSVAHRPGAATGRHPCGLLPARE